MKAYQDLADKINQIQALHGTIALLAWDQETMMPKGGAANRARQLSVVQGIAHQQFTSEVPALLEAAEALDQDRLSISQRQNLIRLRESLNRSSKLPVEHVMAVSRATSEAHQIWVDARKNKDFAHFQGKLQVLLDLKKKEANYLGYEENPYDALMDTYEPGLKSKEVAQVFDGFKAGLLDLLKDIANRPQVDDSFLIQELAQQDQLDFGGKVVARLGYDFEHGRQDISAHPFSIGIAPSDARITTMIHPTDVREMLYSSIHEAGHAMYEQGLPFAEPGMPATEACSLAIHESQSRLWENNVGRSLGFCRAFFDDFRKLMPEALAGKSPEDLFRAVNRVSPHFIRISSDELTYHFHIILRFELENDLLNGRLSVGELPEAWNAKVRSYLGLEVPDASQGVLQDIHWSHGSFGYFPTYSLGSFYAAQLMAAAEKAHPGLEDRFEQGDFSQLRNRLRTHVHQEGRLWLPSELVEKATGEPLNVQYFADYARKKFGQVYDLSPSTV